MTRPVESTAPRSGIADSVATAPPEARVAGYRLVRRLASGERADIHLAARVASTAAASDSESESALVVLRLYGVEADDEVIAAEIDAMAGDDAGMLPRLVDLTALPDGRTCVVVEHLRGHSLAEVLARGALSPGEAVTVLAPVVVAVGRLAARGFAHTRLTASDVLIDLTGRPRLIGLGALERVDREVPVDRRIERSRRAHTALTDLFVQVVGPARTSRFAEVEALLREMSERRPFAPDHVAIERALFAAADPTPIRVTRSGRPGAVPSRIDPSGNRTAGRRVAELAQMPATLADELGEAADGEAVARVRRRLTEWAAGRRPVLLVGGLAGAAALVLLLTMLPPAAAPATPVPTPSTGEAPSDDEAGGVGADATAPGESASGGADAVPAVVAEEPEPAARTLLALRVACLATADAVCIERYAQPGSPIERRDRVVASEGPSDAGPYDPDGIRLVADLGDAVVLEVPISTGREPASLLMMRSEAGWRLREWFD
ncbi:hypothetical protein [Agromyces sp. SYSU T0242]|uniref:hypothetical protein n=1 Tax=Agromyces litoreus TaxID=3158561 RepID=UPI0033916F36